MAEEWKRDRVGAAERGENPTVILRLRSGFAVLADTQFLPRYSILVAAPRVRDLRDLSFAARCAFLADMALLGEAVEAACRPARMNYAVLGNHDPLLHAHVCPRYDWEPEAYRHGYFSKYPPEAQRAAEHRFSVERHAPLMGRIAAALRDLLRREGLEPPRGAG